MTTSTSDADALIDDLTLAQWEALWADVPDGFTGPHRNLRGKSGLYRAICHGETVVIGKPSGKGGSDLKRRISDFIRPSSSGRNYDAGEFLNANHNTLQLMVLVTGTGRSARELAAALKGPMLELHMPRRNVPAHIVAGAIKG